MVVKFVYRMHSFYDAETKSQHVPEQSQALEKLLAMNEQLHQQLQLYKNNITAFHQNQSWDRYKKFVNDYELIFTTCHGLPSISSYLPISRSFFKLWEVMHDFPEAFDMDALIPKRCAFLAEGPGGFIEAYTRKRRAERDTIFGATLLSSDRSIPHWKLKPMMYEHHNMHFLTGKDGTGDICKIENVDAMIQEIGAASCDLITADGGFDFSIDFNNQEQLSSRLILSEIYMALLLQKETGTFFLKIYDIYSHTTIQLLYVLKMFYKSITFIKPPTSRPANSEKYVLCEGFCIRNASTHRSITAELRYYIKHPHENNLFITIPTLFLADLLHYNQYYMHKQILYIYKTLAFIVCIQQIPQSSNTIPIGASNSPIQIHGGGFGPGLMFADVRLHYNLKNQLRKAIKWCTKYHLPISLTALQTYRKAYVAVSAEVSASQDPDPDPEPDVAAPLCCS